MSLFKPAENTMAYFKAGFMGEAGSGKTHTATIVAIGLVQHLKKLQLAGADRPVLMLDTEQGSSWVKPMFDEAGIAFLVAKTRAFKDLVPALREAEKTASVLFIDSITHFWEDLQASYLARMSEVRKRTVHKLEFQDWAYIKGQWRTFSDAFVTSNLHCILSGRLGWEYEQVEDERGKKQIEKSGAKMQAEKGLGYEPNILVWMERNMDLHTKVVARTATVLKDRSRRLDGKQFGNPTFSTFLPHIEFMALGGRHEAVDTERDSTDTIPDEEAPHHTDIKSIRRAIVVEEVQALMLKHFPSRNAEDVKAKSALLVKYFATTSWTEVERLMPLVDLQSNFNNMHCDLEGAPSRYGVQLTPPPAGPVDEIPHLEPAKKAASPSLPKVENAKPDLAKPADGEPAKIAAEPNDLDTIVRDFEAALLTAKDAADRKRIWDETAEIREVMDAERVEKMRLAYGRVLMSPKGKPGRGKAATHMQAAE